MSKRMFFLRAGSIISIIVIYAIYRLSLEIVRRSIGAGGDTGTPLDMLGVLVSVGVAAMVAGVVVRHVFRERLVVGSLLVAGALLMIILMEAAGMVLAFGLMYVYGWKLPLAVIWSIAVGLIVGMKCTSGKTESLWVAFVLLTLMFLAVWLIFVPMEQYLMLFD